MIFHVIYSNFSLGEADWWIIGTWCRWHDRCIRHHNFELYVSMFGVLHVQKVLL